MQHAEEEKKRIAEEKKKELEAKKLERLHMLEEERKKLEKARAGTPPHHTTPLDLLILISVFHTKSAFSGSNPIYPKEGPKRPPGGNDEVVRLLLSFERWLEADADYKVLEKDDLVPVSLVGSFRLPF